MRQNRHKSKKCSKTVHLKYMLCCISSYCLELNQHLIKDFKISPVSPNDLAKDRFFWQFLKFVRRAAIKPFRAELPQKKNDMFC